MKKTLVIVLFLLLTLIIFSLEANYELVTKWSSTKDTWQNPWGIAVDSEGFVYVAGEQKIVKYKSDGTFVLKVENIKNSEDYYFSSGEMYVAVDDSGNIYVSSTSDHMVVKFNSQGKYLAKWNAWDSGADYFNNPQGIAVEDSGNVYVCDRNNARIVKFDSNGTYINEWAHGFNCPSDIAIFDSNNIYVVDQNNHRIQVFDSNGTFKREWGSWGSGDSQFKWPNGIDVDFEGNVYVINPSPLNRISKFSSDGTFLAKWGGYGNDNFHFNDPRDVAVDYSGNVFVVDRMNFRIMKYRKAGAPRIEITNPTINESLTGTIAIQANVTVPSGYTISNVEFYRDDVKLGEDSTAPFELVWNTIPETNGPYTIWVVATNNESTKSKEKVPVVVANGVEPPTVTITNPGDQDKVKDSIDIEAAASDDGGIAKVEYYVDGVKVGEDTSGPSPYIYNWDTTTVNDGEKKLKVIAFDTIGQRASDTITIIVKNQEEFGYVVKWSIDNPTGIAVDKNRNVYVASCDNRIRKYDADGNFLFSIESSSTGDYTLSCNMSIAADLSGNIYVSAHDIHSIVKFDAKGNYLKKWGSYGTENTQLINPGGIAVDGSGYVYVCDQGNRRIVKYTSEGVYENKWGTQGGGDTQFQCPLGVAVDASNNVYVIDTCNGKVQVFDSNGNFLRKWGECCGLGDNQFNNPKAIAVDSEGNVYVADTGNFRIVKYSSDGTFLTKWGSQGSGDLQFGTPWGIAVDSLGYIYVVDQNPNNRILKFRSTWIPTIEITNPADNSIITGSWTIQVNAQSEIGISKVKFYINGTKEHEDITGPSPYTYDWDTSSLSNGTYTLKAIAYNADNKSREDEISVVLNKTGDDKLPTLSLTNPKAGDTIRLRADIQAEATDKEGIDKVEFYVDGNLTNTAIVSPPSLSYIYSYTWDATTVEDGERKIKVRAYDTIGQNVEVSITLPVINHEEFGYVAKTSLDRPSDVTLDKSGNLYVAGGHQISKYNPAGNLILKIENNSSYYNFSWWMHIAVDNSGNIYVTNQDDNTVVKFDSKGNYVKKWGSFGSDNNQFYTPRGIAVDSDGNIYVCDHSNHRILKYNSGGTYITKWGTQGGSDGKFNNPQGIAVDSSNNIYVTDFNNHRIQVFSSSGVFIRKWGSYGYQDNQLRNPSGIAFDSEGNILVADNGNYRVVKYTSNGAFLTKWGTRGSGDLQFECANGIAVDSNFYVYVADNCNNRILKFKSTWKPTVEITSPADNSIITGPVTIQATVESAIAISKVEFYINGTKEYEDTSGPSPYTYDWNISSLSNGTYKIKAIAYNIQGKSTESDEISVVVNNTQDKLPTVSITNPKAGDIIRLRTDIQADASDEGGGISKVEFYVDGNLVNTAIISPPSLSYGYSYTWDATAVEDGEREIKVRAYDTIGQNVEASITVTVINHEEFGFLDKWSGGNPTGLALDKEGNLYVAGGYQISKYTPNGNLILKIENNSSDYNFSGGMHVAVDNSGYIYVTNDERSTVIKFNSSGNYVTKWGSFGSGNYQFNSPQGIAVDSNRNVYVCDHGNQRIVKYDSNGTFLATWGTQGGSDGQLNWPMGIAVDASNNIYVADRSNNRIQVFTSNGEFLRKWGSWGYEDNNLRSPLGIAFDSEGNVYIVDSANYRVVKYTSDGTFLAKWGTRGNGNLQFECLYDIVVDSNFYAYVSDNCNNRIMKFKSTWRPTVEITNPADNSIITEPVTIQATVESAIAISKVEFYIKGTKEHEDTTGPSPYTYDWDPSSLSDGTYTLKAIAYNIQGKSTKSDEISVVVNNTLDKLPTVSITNPKTGDIIRLQATLKAEATDKEGIDRIEFYIDGTKVGKDTSNPYEYSWDATAVEDGERKIKVRAYDTIGQNVEATVIVTVINHEEFAHVGKWYMNNPSDVAIDKHGNFHVAGGSSISKYTADGILLFKIENQQNASYNLSWWLRVAVDDSGNIYASNSDKNNVIKFDANGNYVTKWGSFGNGNNQFNNPTGIAVDKNGNVYVCDYNNNRIVKYNSGGTFLAKWGTQGGSDGQFNGPQGIAVDASNNIYVTDQHNHRIQVFTSTGEFLRKWGSSGYDDNQFRWPLAIALDKEGNVYVIDPGNYRIVKYTSNGTFLAKWGTQGNGDLQFECPNGIAIDYNFNVYVTDNCNNRVLKFKSTWKPAVEITNPADNSVITGPVTIQATVESAIGISKVEFYINGTKKHEDTIGPSPYTYDWNTSSLPDGTFTIKAIAYNVQGKSTESDEISVIVNNTGDEAPTVSIMSPEDGEAIRKTVEIKADTSDDKGIDKVEFYVNGTLVDSITVSPLSLSYQYTYSWDTTTKGDGESELKVVVYDMIGQNTSAAIMAKVANQEAYDYLAKWSTWDYGNPRAITVDKYGHIYVTFCNSIVKFTPTGSYLLKITNEGNDNNYQLTCSMRIAVDDDCNIYVSNRETHQIIKFDSKGKFVTKWGSQGDKDNQFNGPEGLAVDHEGNVYVCDSENHRIVKYSSGGIFLAKFGTRGNGDEQFQYPIGIDLDESNNMYVAEAWNNRIQVLNSEGTYLRKWGNHGYGDSQFRCLQAIALDSEGNVYTTDGCNHRVQKFSADGTFITKWGSYGKGDNNFDNPFDITVNSSGYAYVTDHGNQRIAIFRVLGTPSVAITSPADNSSVSGTVKIQASAASEFGINRVEFYIGGELKHSDTDFPYEYTWDTTSYSNGSYEIKAIAYNTDLKRTETSISVIVNNGGDIAPTVSITNIKEGAVIRGTVTVKADATDDLGISKVEFYVDGTLLGTDNTQPYEFSWDTTTVADSEKELKVVAYDTLGQRTWASIKVIVDNANAVFSVDLTEAAVVFINTERKLRKIDLNGNISPVINTDPDVAQFQFGPEPEGNIYLFFWNPQELRDGNSYILAKVNPETNEAIGIDKTLSHIEWNEQTASPNIQFDGLGNIYYLARDSQWNLVLRKYTSEAQIEDLIHESIRIYHWHVREDGTVILGGETETTHLRWLRKLNLDGSLANIAEPSEIGWIKEFPDNRVYAGMRFSAWHHGVYRLPEDLSHMAEEDEKKPYIGHNYDGYQPEYNVDQLKEGYTDEYCRGFYLWQGGAMLYSEKDDFDNVYGLMASWWDVYRTVLKLYPQPEVIEPHVVLLDRPTLIKVWRDKLIIAGSKDGVNKLVLYDISTKEETNLLNKNIEIYHLDVLSNGDIIFDGLNFENNRIVVVMLKQQASAPAGKVRALGYGFKELTELGGKPLSFGVFKEVSGSQNISVSITSLLSGSTVCGEVNIKAAAYSPGGVSQVEFYIDGELKATDTTSPYSCSWDTKSCPDGSYTIKVKAYDKAAQTAVSEITVTVDNTSPGEIDLSTTQMYFGAATNTNPTASQKFITSNTGGGALNWTATSSENWLKVSPTSGKGSGIVTVSANTSGLSIGTYTGKITVQDPKATNSPQTINVTLKIYSSISVQKPFGSFDTPINGTTGITGAVPLTGWALDDIEVTKVEIWRDPVGGEPKAANGMVYIGNAILIEGARPDVVQNYPNYPLNFQAGWGYMLLTSYLPNQGNGTYTIYAVAYDKEGNKADLGAKTISCDNSHATKPFGTIDTPAQGGEASGKNFVNFGWALTPNPNYIPQDGSTITVWINGEEVGHPVYNQSRQDVATLFPGYTNSNGAVGYFFLDTTQYKNGVHTMAWNVKDSAGNKDDIGTRYFTTVNVSSMGTSFSGMGSQTQTNLDHRLSFESVYSLPTSFASLKVWRSNRSEAEPETAEGDRFGIIDLEIREVERLKLYLGDTTACDGYLVVGEKLRPLPVGSTLNVKKGTFSWQPGPGFIGTYDFIFLAKDENGLLKKIRARITISPKFDIY